jgi:hypothetical protein
MHLHAYSKRQLHDLNEIELIDTRETIATCAGQVAVGLLSVVITFLLPDRLAGMSGFTYMLIGVTNTWMGTHYGRQRRSAETRLLGAHSAAVHV